MDASHGAESLRVGHLEIEPGAQGHHPYPTRHGRSEFDLGGEGLELVLRVVRELEKGTWPQVVSKAVTSEALRETLLELVGVLKGGSPGTEKASQMTQSVRCEALERCLGERGQQCRLAM